MYDSLLLAPGVARHMTQIVDLSARSRGAIWHPCTQMARFDAVPPLSIARGNGPWLLGTDGRRFFDANSSWWVSMFGHNDLPLHNAIKTQLDTLPT